MLSVLPLPGHRFVSAIHNPKFATEDLISGGGDPALKIWDWMTGTMKHEVNVWDSIQPYMKVCGKKRRRGDDDLDESEVDGHKGKKAKRKKKGNTQVAMHTEVPTNEDIEECSWEAEDGNKPEKVTMESHQSKSEEQAEQVLVIHKIDTMTSESSHYIIFNIVGATALFVSPYPTWTTNSDVRAFDLGQPVIDFTVSNDGLIWVAVDAAWSEEGPTHTNKSAMIRVLKLSSGQLAEATLDSPLLSSLNERCLLPATADDLQKLDLYGDLTSMPKGSDVGQDPGSRHLDENPIGKQVSKKELGRLKSKQAVLEKVQAIGGGVANFESREEDDDRLGEAEREPEAKKTKAEQSRAVDGIEGDADVIMSGK